VTDAGGTHHGLAGVQVQVTSASTAASRYATTAANGTYAVLGLSAGTDYTVCFTADGATGGVTDALGYLGQCYDNQPSSGTPTPVTVTPQPWRAPRWPGAPADCKPAVESL
jgi:hypothetical protein